MMSLPSDPVLPYVRTDRLRDLYHFTDTRNLPSIREHGGLFPLAELRRRGISIRAPGGSELSHRLDTERGLDEYVHLCFRAQHPMEHVARQDGRIAESVFLRIDARVAAWPDVRFASGIAYSTGFEIHAMDEAFKLIDFEVLYRYTDWRDSDIQERLKRATKYELLVPRKIPIALIRNIPDG